MRIRLGWSITHAVWHFANEHGGQGKGSWKASLGRGSSVEGTPSELYPRVLIVPPTVCEIRVGLEPAVFKNALDGADYLITSAYAIEPRK